MKKICTVLGMITVLLTVNTSFALAAQNLDPSAVSGDVYSDYLPTPKTVAQPYPNGIYIQKDSNGNDIPIHSNYSLNTDACASCHATHTGVGPELLQWASGAETCEACHDGTLGDTYNVVSGIIPGGARTSGGLFGTGNEGIASLSRHSVNEVDISAAPGGNSNPGSDPNSPWNHKFECTSCHDPHGLGGNFRLLNPNPMDMAVANRKTGEVLSTSDNIVFKSVYYPWLTSYPYSTYTKVYVDGVVADSSIYTINSNAGEVVFNSPITKQVSADYVPVFKVEGNVVNKLTVNEQVYYGAGINDFCGACHPDYKNVNTNPASSATVLSGTYASAYAHPVGFQWDGAPVIGLKLATNSQGPNEVTCLTCHVAHGVDEGWWTDWKTTSGWTGTVTAETSGSSSLKRLPNESACQDCHQM